jgi:hypothetical protein
MSLNAINIPLIALFGLSYGMGHPAVAPFRPALVDKTLVSFHEDINRTAKDLNEGLANLAFTRSVLARSAEAPAPRLAAAPKASVKIEAPDITHARNVLGLPEHRPRDIAEPVRVKAQGPVKAQGFTELKAQ